MNGWQLAQFTLIQLQQLYCIPLVQWSLHKYKCLWSVRYGVWGVRAGVQVSKMELHTQYNTLRLGYSWISFWYIKQRIQRSYCLQEIIMSVNTLKFRIAHIHNAWIGSVLSRTQLLDTNTIMRKPSRKIIHLPCNMHELVV